jgi:hypothetical protein
MSKQQGSAPVDLDSAAVTFAVKYWKKGSGIKGISKTSEGIEVVVGSINDAKKLPAITAEGVPVSTVQDFGPILGKRAIIRDKTGKPVGAQG